MCPPTQLRSPQNLGLGSPFSVLGPGNKAELQTPQNSGFIFRHPRVGFDWQDQTCSMGQKQRNDPAKRQKNCYEAAVTLGQGH